MADCPSEKRNRVVKMQSSEDQENSDQFWKHTKYFGAVVDEDKEDDHINNDEDDDNDDENDEEDFEPDIRKLVKLDSESVSDSSYEEIQEDDIVDSQLYETIDEGDDQSVQEIIVQSISLAKTNLVNYSFIRGIHHIQNIEELPRVGQTTYVQYEDGLTYKPNPILNRQFISKQQARKYLGIPYTKGNTGYDEQEKTKTEFHGQLFRMEDQRYDIDFSIRQFRWVLKKIEQDDGFNLMDVSKYSALKSLPVSEDTLKEDLIIVIQTKLLDLYKQKEMIKMVDEPFIFKQSIDQAYSMKKRQVLNALSSRKIQQDFNTKIISIDEFLVNCETYDEEKKQMELINLFTAQTSLNQSVLLQDYVMQYDLTKMSIPPSATLIFDYSLTHAVDMIKASLKIKGSSPDSIFMRDVFDDLIKGFFGATDNLPINVDIFDTNNFDEIYSQDLVLKELKQNNNPLVGVLLQPCETSLFNFFPYTSNHYLMGRPILSYLIYCFHLIYQRVNVLTEMTKSVNVSVGNKYMDLQEVCMDLIRRTLNMQMSEAEMQSLLRHIFSDEMAMQTQGLIYLLIQFGRILCSFQFDDISMQFFLVWVRQIPNSTLVSHTQLLNNMNQEQILQGIAGQLRQPRCGMCRVQKMGSVVTIHNFDIARREQDVEIQVNSSQDENSIALEGK